MKRDILSGRSNIATPHTKHITEILVDAKTGKIISTGLNHRASRRRKPPLTRSNTSGVGCSRSVIADPRFRFRRSERRYRRDVACGGECPPRFGDGPPSGRFAHTFPQLVRPEGRPAPVISLSTVMNRRSREILRVSYFCWVFTRVAETLWEIGGLPPAPVMFSV